MDKLEQAVGLLDLKINEEFEIGTQDGIIYKIDNRGRVLVDYVGMGVWTESNFELNDLLVYDYEIIR